MSACAAAVADRRHLLRHRQGEPGEVWTAKYQRLGTIMAASMAALAVYLLIGTMRGGFPGYSGLSVIPGIVFAGSGNYPPIIPPNKWVGIRVPRTLKHKDVWEKTHRYGGRVFLICGLHLILNGLLIPPPVVNITMLVPPGFAAAPPLPFAYRTEPERDELV